MNTTKNLISPRLEAIRNNITGTLLLPDDGEYDTARKAWLDVAEQRPSAIVQAASVEDIAEAIRVANDLELPLGVQNTGHGIAVPCNEGILLRLGGMKEIQVDPGSRTATFGPGVTSRDLLPVLGSHGFSYPSGQVSNVGVTGYTLGGGYGWLGRKVGPACHTMRSATVVLADGRIVTASETENADLFWALRGGGGNFGVVASMTVDLHTIPEVFGGVAYYRMEDAAEVLHFYREWSGRLSHDTSTYVRLMAIPPIPELVERLHGNLACVLGVCHTDLATGNALHQQILDFKKPAIDQLKTRPYSDMGSVDFASSLDHSTTFSHVEGLRELNREAIEGILKIAKNSIPPLMILELQQLGGALTGFADADMAYTAPTASFYLKIVSPAFAASLEQLAPLTMDAVHSLGNVYTAEATYNWLRGDQQIKLPTVFGVEKYARLQQIKKKYDPTNLFRLNLNIPPAA